MSVLKAHRTESKAEFVNVANQIYVQTIQFLSRLSSRYSRLLSSPVSALASEVIDHAEKANSIYPSDDLRKELRKTHLLEARASLMALDVHLAHCYEVMMLNLPDVLRPGQVLRFRLPMQSESWRIWRKVLESLSTSKTAC